ncbi:hypothetical protein LPTSP4_19650 [Leptospira ryugenii]|uniref:Lipoprotein n=1 Tax=Leptospira ryugenii TaxID=1917863 RepID=A0A2P2E0M7_9LEPT|nr:hypothetical protein [Leptospira ryugenii]GBF50440.1 hypothetical protein LPTSP4_19650 [Leptospira ryugenii]
MRVNLLLYLGFLLISCSATDKEDMEIFKKAKREYSLGNLKVAEALFLSIENKGIADVNIYLAKLAFYQGKFQLAKEKLEPLVNGPIFNFQAKLLEIKIDFVLESNREKVREKIQSLFAQSNGQTELHLLAAKMEKELGNIPGAIFHYEEVIRSVDHVVLAHKGLASLFQTLGLKDKEHFHEERIQWLESTYKSKQKEKRYK